MRDAAISQAIDTCIEENILHDILLTHKSEVMDMVLTEFDAEKHDRHIDEQGQRKGQRKERLDTIRRFSDILTVDQLLAKGYTQDEIDQAHDEPAELDEP